VAEPARTELVQGPAVQPKLVDPADEAAPMRRGWWKR
jgi:ribonuclease E